MSLSPSLPRLLARTYRATYVEPLRNARRIIAYASSMAGSAGLTCIGVALPFDYAAHGATWLSGYFTAFFAAMSFLFFPLVYWGLSVADGRGFRLLLLAAETAFLALLFVTDGPPPFTGFIMAGVVAAYYSSLHIAMFRNTTDAHRGFQVVLGHIAMISASVMASLCAGWWMHRHGVAQPVILAGGTGIVLGMAGLLSLCPRQPRQSLAQLRDEASRVWSACRPSLHRWFFLGVADAPFWALTGLLYLKGTKILDVGLLIAARTLLLAILAPLIGRMAQSHAGLDYRIGLALYAISWGIVAFWPQDHYALGGFVFLSGVAMRFMLVGTEVAIYDRKSYVALGLYELCLGLGRAPVALLAFPVLFLNPVLYAALVGGLQLLALGVDLVRRRGTTRTRAPG